MNKEERIEKGIKWNFDFQNEKPLDGKWDWELTNKTPEFYQRKVRNYYYYYFFHSMILINTIKKIILFLLMDYC